MHTFDKRLHKIRFAVGKYVALVLAVFLSVPGVHAAGQQVNLLANGGFEKDSNGDGVADGWIAQPFNFSRQTLNEVQSYLENLPPWEQLLEGKTIPAADGTAMWARTPEGNWPKKMIPSGGQYWGPYERHWKREVNWYERVKRVAIPRSSRFGELPVPDDLDLGAVTLMLSAKRPHGQVVSEPIAVKPDTGYRLRFHVRTSGGGEYWRGPQVLDGACDPESLPVSNDHYGDAQVLNAIPAKYWWGSGIAGHHWARMDLPFRTGPGCESIIIRLPYNHRDEAGRREMNNENYRIWYDDLRLLEDDSVRGADEGYAPRPKPEWPAEAMERGFVVAGRPTLPITYSSFKPSLEETAGPIRLALAPGETDSVVIYVQNLLKEPIALRATVRGFTSERGEEYVLSGAQESRFITLRAAEMEWRRPTAKRYVYAPKYLLNSTDLSLPSPGHGGQYWMTVTVLPGTSPGEYTGHMTITRVKPAGGEAGTRELKVPVVLIVRDMALEEADAAFFVWADPSPVPRGSPMGPPLALPGAAEIYFADQRRHGMNTIATYCYAESQDRDGKVSIRFNELDALMEFVRRAGLCRDHPLLLHTWSRALEYQGKADFSVFAGGAGTVQAITTHARKAGWPDVLYGVSDEPNSDKKSAFCSRMIKSQYAEARKQGVRTAVAGGYPGAFTRPLNEKGDTLGDLFDVWIEGMYGSRWPEMHEAAAKNDAELWMYNCWVTSAGYLQERFYAGLWTWRTGVKGNGAWAFGWYVRISDSGLPESKIAWEGRMAGVNDYRYLQTLEHTIAAGDASGKAGAAVRDAKSYLEALRRRIPYSAYKQRSGGISQNQWAELDAWNPVPGIRPEDYAGIRDDCARHITAVRRECGM